jgi:unsaturated rhamnogalacturonyl hydrolase
MRSRIGVRMRESSPLAPCVPAENAILPRRSRTRAHVGAALAFLVAVQVLYPQSQSTDAGAASVLRIMERVADWQLANPSAHPLTDWTQGAGYTGFMALSGISANPRYRDAMVRMGEETRWQPGPRIYHADDHCVGQTYAELFMLYREPRMIAGLRERFDSIIEKPSLVKGMDFTQPGGRATELWSWCDSLFMAPPAWMSLYRATGDSRYMDFAVRNWWATTDFLYDKDEHLFYRDSTYFGRHEANGRKVFWSRGNGWVIAGLVRVLEMLPTDHPDRPRFEQLFREMAAKVLACQQPDGLWRASLLDPASFPLREASGSGFFTYALAWGLNQGLLDRAQFVPAVQRAWTSLVACVGPEGKLAHVQPIGADPKAFPEGSTEAYGVGAFLLAGSEVYRLSLGIPTGNGETPAGCRFVVVTNPAPFFRGEETVEIDSKASGIAGNIAVMDGVSSRILASQVYSPAPGGAPVRLLFQVDIAPRETRRYCILSSGALPPAMPTAIVRTYARQVAERYNDVAWESDRIAHRMYSLDLIKGEGTISSGIDVWAKRTRSLVIDEWYKRTNYHQDDGDGLDDYQVGRSRGCGGLGVWSGRRLFTSINFRSAQIITTGPIRSEFELTYDAWDAGGRKVAERKRISIDAGSNMSRAESVFTSDDPAPLDIGIGIAQRAGSDGIVSKNGDAGWMTYWQAPDRDRGSIGCAVILPVGGVHTFVGENASVPAVAPERQITPGIEGLPPVGNLLGIARADPGNPLVYYFGAGWSKSGDFPDDKTWMRFVSRFAERVRAPLRVSVAP